MDSKMHDAIQRNLRNDPALLTRWEKIRLKLETAKGRLKTYGGVRKRHLENGTIVWVVRYPDRCGGKHVDRSIYLGCEPLAKCARALIQQWRDKQITPEELHHRETVQLLDISASGLGFSKRARIRLKDAAEAAKDDPRAMLELVYGHPSSPIRFGRGPGGRRGRGRLW